MESIFEIISDIIIGKSKRPSKIIEFILRFIIGLLGSIGALIGAYHIALTQNTGVPLRMSVVLMFFFLLCFFLFNVMCYRKWLWPGICLLLCLPLLFLVRIIFGA